MRFESAGDATDQTPTTSPAVMSVINTQPGTSPASSASRRLIESEIFNLFSFPFFKAMKMTASSGWDTELTAQLGVTTKSLVVTATWFR